MVFQVHGLRESELRPRLRVAETDYSQSVVVGVESEAFGVTRMASYVRELG